MKNQVKVYDFWACEKITLSRDFSLKIHAFLTIKWILKYGKKYPPISFTSANPIKNVIFFNQNLILEHPYDKLYPHLFRYLYSTTHTSYKLSSKSPHLVNGPRSLIGKTSMPGSQTAAGSDLAAGIQLELCSKNANFFFINWGLKWHKSPCLGHALSLCSLNLGVGSIQKVV